MTFTNSGSTFFLGGGGFTVGGGAESALFSSGMAEFDKKLDGIMEIRSPAVDEKLSIFRLEKRNLAKIRSNFGICIKQSKFRKFWTKISNFKDIFGVGIFIFFQTIGKKFDGMTDSGTP